MNLDPGTRKSNECSNKFHPIPHENFGILRSGIIQILHYCSSVRKDNLRYYKIFFWLNLIYFGQKESFEVKFSGF